MSKIGVSFKYEESEYALLMAARQKMETRYGRRVSFPRMILVLCKEYLDLLPQCEESLEEGDDAA